MNFQEISLVTFIILLTLTIIFKRKKIEIQRMLFPLLYAGLYRSNFGLKWMDRISSKYREWVILFGYIGIGFGFVGMIFIVISIIKAVFITLTTPGADAGVAFVLPQTNIPGIGFLPFWYWILALFILVVIHEFAHGVVARAHRIKIKSSGLGFFAIILPIIPLAFVEPDEKQVSKASDIVQYSIYAAGPFANIVTAIIVFFMFLTIFAPITNALVETDGIIFDKINESYPSFVLPNDFVIRSINGENITHSNIFFVRMSAVNPGDIITLGNGTDVYELETILNPEPRTLFGLKGIETKAMIGIMNIKVNSQLKEGVNELGYSIFVWFKGLFKWVGLLSFAIGLMNLLPLGPIDGGRMVRTFIHKLDKKKAGKRFGLISLIMLILLLLTIFPAILRLF